MATDQTPHDELKKPLELSYERRPADVDSAGRLVIQLNQQGRGMRTFPSFCCSCLEPSTERWRLPIAFPVSLTVPICPACRQRYHRRYLISVAVSICLTLIISMLCVPLTGEHSPGRVVLAMIFFIGPLALASAIIIPYVTLPVRLGFWINGMTKTRIRFRNPGFSQLLHLDGSEPDPAEKFILPAHSLSEKALRAREQVGDEEK